MATVKVTYSMFSLVPVCVSGCGWSTFSCTTKVISNRESNPYLGFDFATQNHNTFFKKLSALFFFGLGRIPFESWFEYYYHFLNAQFITVHLSMYLKQYGVWCNFLLMRRRKCKARSRWKFGGTRKRRFGDPLPYSHILTWIFNKPLENESPRGWCASSQITRTRTS